MTPKLKHLGWALAGAAIGAAVGLFTAPASGRETRRRLSRRLTEETEDLILESRRRLAEVANG
ncbi:MAG: YtxH domain-containing protein [Acidobacteria bacterium]|nr:YtxH domain-containing protein [Acidobacteriota bacterium]